ncbi:MAG TPA: FAD-binding oxidoreductase [Stellaceae bacterium]
MTTAARPEFLIVGGGIAGASAGFFLSAAGHRVTLLEREAAPGYHSTGRSAALYSENYGSAAIRALTSAGRAFFDAPPPGFADHKLLLPRGVLMVAPAAERGVFERELAEGLRSAPGLREVTRDEAIRLCPALAPDWLDRALYEPHATDIDVHALHQGFLRGLRAGGGAVVTDADVRVVERLGGVGGGAWRVTIAAGDIFEAPVLINAAGAWADEMARLAGARPVGLTPKRRTAFTIDPPPGLAVERWPMVIRASETLYFKPEAGRILVSPADETPTPPCDVQPDEIDVAEAAARLEEATTLRVRRIAHKWAGLRSFVADKTPVVGFDPNAEGFFWLAGQGGYGIQTSPAMGRVAASLAAGRGLPADIADRGVTEAVLSPARFARSGPVQH